MFKFYGRTQPLAHDPIGRCLQTLQQLGFDGVEICLENPDLHPSQLTHAQAQGIRDLLQTLGLTSYSVSYHKDYIHEDDELALTLKSIEACPSFGTDLFVFSGGKRQSHDQTEWNWLVTRTRQLVACAEEHGVTLALEFEPGFVVGSTADLLRLMDEIDSPYLMANLDLGHVFLCDPDPIAAIHSLQGKVAHGHIENMRTGVHDHLLPQEGDIDLAAYLGALHEIGFDGPLALDLYKYDYEAVAPEALCFLRGLASQCI